MRAAHSILPRADAAAVRYLRDLMENRGHAVFENDERPYNLNFVGIRGEQKVLDRFGCELVAFWKYRGKWTIRRWSATTLPGSRYMVRKLLNPAGCAILVPGQYRSIYRLDQHGGKYEALCQRGGQVRVYRDGDRDNEFDLEPGTIQRGNFGINIHAPITVRNGVSEYCALKVIAASAGCQVFQCVADFYNARDLWRAARQQFGNSFTYTLIDPTQR